MTKTAHAVQMVAITFDDGSVGIMSFLLDPNLPSHAALPGWDRDAGRRKATDRAIQHEIDRSAWGERTPVSWRRMDVAEVPTDRTFRNAWHDPDGKRIAVHMGRARELHRAHLRELRAPLLAELDVAYQRADEAGDTAAKATIAERKRALRDITAHPDIEKAKTPDELNAVTISA